MKPCFRLAVLTSLVFLGCSGKNIHPNLKEDSSVAIREWTVSTFPLEGRVAGDRGAEFSHPLLLSSPDTLIFGSRTQGLTALYPHLGQTRWKFPIRQGVLSGVNAQKDMVFFVGGDGFLYALDVKNGKEVWKYEIRNPIVSKPVYSQGRVLVTTTDDTVYAFDAGTGKWLWHYRRKTSAVASILGASAPLVDKNEVIVGMSDGYVVALSLEEGQLKWQRKLHDGIKFTDVDAEPLLVDQTIYVPSYDGALYALKRGTGEIIWKFEHGGSKQPAVAGDLIFMPSSEGTIYAVKRSNGQVLWKFELDGGTPTPLVVTKNFVAFGSTHQYFYVLDRESGKALYRYNIGYGNGFYGSPAYDPVKKMIFTLSSGGNLYSFRLKE